MVSIFDYKEAINQDGEEFYMLLVMGGIEPVQSKTTGRTYLTARKAAVSTTFNEQTCKGLIGQNLPGSVVKVETEPYSYTIEETGEEITLSHTYEYDPEFLTMEETVNENPLTGASPV
jgi:hypothetical protein